MEDFYRQVYRGNSLTDEELGPLLCRAEDWLTGLERRYRVTGAADSRKLALCALADALGYYDAAQNGQGALRYASAGTVSVSGKGIYTQLDIRPEARERELYRIAGQYLDIYRGANA